MRKFVPLLYRTRFGDRFILKRSGLCELMLTVERAF